MPCFKGLAVSIHTPDGPLSEYSVQKVSRVSRISTYIPVPPPRIPPSAADELPKAEPSTFAISITLLTPGQDVPYSMPKPTADNPSPKPRLVGNLPGHGGERGKYQGAVGPYVPLTTSPNETIAAYIYFDGRAKEEVATLLRKGEETWVNSRWVGVPESEGGGLAEREFLFREVGLERWLNGLDLEGQDAAAIIERRRQKLEKRRRKRREAIKKEAGDVGSDDEEGGITLKRVDGDARKKTLRYGADGQLQELSDDEDDDASLSDSDSDDDDPIPEATGQIKVALFRVLASGEIKRGEYSPQFDAHDDDEESGQNGNSSAAGGGGKDVDHTTSFAKPKTLDPKTISTQTVTGIDPTDKPYATFTFFYRGERQLQKMGILPTPKSDKTSTVAKRRSGIPEIPTLGPLKKEGTVGFVGYREKNSRRKSPKGPDAMESDSEDDEDEMRQDDDHVDHLDATKKGSDNNLLSPEDAERAGQVSEGIRKMKLKRQHSAEPLNANANANANTNGDASKTPLSKSTTPSNANSPPLPGEDLPENADTKVTGATMFGDVKKDDDISTVGSPFKRQRSSMADFDDGLKERLSASGLSNASSSINEIIGGGAAQKPTSQGSGLKFGGALLKKVDDDDEEL